MVSTTEDGVGTPGKDNYWGSQRCQESQVPGTTPPDL